MLTSGTPGGEKKVPESLGLAPGVVFLVCIILFQLLQYYDVPSVVHWLQTLGKEGALKQARPSYPHEGFMLPVALSLLHYLLDGTWTTQLHEGMLTCFCRSQ